MMLALFLNPPLAPDLRCDAPHATLQYPSLPSHAYHCAQICGDMSDDNAVDVLKARIMHASAHEVAEFD